MSFADSLLDTWSKARREPPLGRTLALLQLAAPGADLEQLAALPIGRRDARLLAWRNSILGHELRCLMRCPACGLDGEFSLDSRALVRVAEVAAEPVVEREDYRVELRPINSSDLAQAGAAASSRRLLERAIVRAERAGQRVSSTELPDSVLDAIEQQLLALDPLLELQLALTCPGCAHAHATYFDVAEFVWAEVADTAQRLLREVDVLARAYGWSEREILALSASRRQLYLEQVGA